MLLYADEDFSFPVVQILRGLVNPSREKVANLLFLAT